MVLEMDPQGDFLGAVARKSQKIEKGVSTRVRIACGTPPFIAQDASKIYKKTHRFQEPCFSTKNTKLQKMPPGTCPNG